MDETLENGAGAPLSNAPVPAPHPPPWRRRSATTAAVVGMAAGGLVGGYLISQAATATTTPSASPSSGAGGTSPAPPPRDHRGPGGPGGPGNAAARSQDEQDVATAIGITVAQLRTELAGGKTIAQVAQAHKVDPATVITALVTAENKEVDAALASGQITSAEAAQMKAMQKQRVTDMVNGTGGPRGGHPGGPDRGLRSEDAQVVAGAIGITAAQLQTELAGGKTIAQVAQAHQVDPNTVISAWTTSENKEIDDRVASGQLTQAQGTAEKAGTQQRITDEVNGVHRGGPHGGPHGGPPGSGA